MSQISICPLANYFNCLLILMFLATCFIDISISLFKSSCRFFVCHKTNIPALYPVNMKYMLIEFFIHHLAKKIT